MAIAYAPEHFRHLVRAGRVTVLGFGSLVSERSARESFEFCNFRLGTIQGAQRIFNRADWINIEWGDARCATGEVCSLALALTGERRSHSRVALMDVPFEGVAGFLHRESAYRILELPYVDDLGAEGLALACGECDDCDMRRLWGEDVWYLQHCRGRISYVGDAVPAGHMPLVPSIEGQPGDPGTWLELTAEGESGEAPYLLPSGPWVYPSPGYLRMVYRAHGRAGILDNLLDTTLLMDRKTTLRTYLEANPLLKDWVADPHIYSDRACDRDAE